ncbi:hypothetical protein V2I01_01640 [Micromonospora sp. BRA006-A]|nr:hypothetical protein [Micromonospora sp. BRA006-A]
MRMAATPRLDFALDTYECIVLYPGPSGRALPDETVQRLQAEHLQHMRALQRRGIVLVDRSVDGPAREPTRRSVSAWPGPVRWTTSAASWRPTRRCRPGSTGSRCSPSRPAGSLEFPLVKTES